MAISNTASRNTYTLDAVTTDFDITFDCVFDDNGDATELTVWLIDSEGNRTEVTKGYASDQYSTAYKTVTYLDATSHAGETLLISRATPRTQLMDFINNGAYNLNQVEAMSDKLTRIVQEQDDTIVDRIQTSEQFAESAKESAEAALASEQNAKTSEDNAKESEDNAKVSEDNAKDSEDNAKDSAEDSEAWAVGKRNGQDVPSTDPTYHNNAQYYADLAAHLISGGVRYIGTWNTTGQTDYSSLGTPRAKGDLFYVQGTGCTIDGVEYKLGDIIIFNDDVPSGTTIATSAIDKIDNTETVTPDNTCTLENKTIPLGDNDITTTANKVIVSDADGNIGAGSVDASKIVSTDGTQTLTNKTITYAYNSLTGVQPTLTAGTGIDITGTTISSTIQGHRYCGRGVNTLTHDYISSGDTSYSFTLDMDRFVNILFCNSGSATAEWTVYVNNVEQGKIPTYTSNPVWRSMVLPLKTGDVVKIDIANKGTGTCTVRVLQNLYMV